MNANTSTSCTPFKYNSSFFFFRYMGYACTALLFLDYTVRLLICPSVRRFCVNIIHMCDLLAVVAAITKYIIDAMLPKEQYTENSWSDLIHSLQLLRVLRILGPMSKVRFIFSNFSSCIIIPVPLLSPGMLVQ